MKIRERGAPKALGLNFDVSNKMTSFIGREDFLQEAIRALQATPLVTLTGIGGVGKTRLATELVEQFHASFNDGACLVELDTLDHDEGVAGAIALALAIPDQSNRSTIEKVVDSLRDREVLLLLDNCEHVLQEAASVVTRILASTTHVRILTTSREALNVSGERVLLVPPLATPPETSQKDHQSVASYEAVQLLVDRATNHVPDFSLTSENVYAVAQICRLLDGIPLALELAATRLRSLSAAQLLERIDDRFRLLTVSDHGAVARQRTLQALIDWSYELCCESEQTLWRRLSIFVGTFDIEAAEAVCAFDGLERAVVFDTLDRLVAKSLIVAERRPDKVRYRLLMTIREYGMELLRYSGDEIRVRTRHRDHYIRAARTMVSGWCGPGQAQALTEMRENHANLSSALEWSLGPSGDINAGATLASLLRFHWIAGGFLSAGRKYLEGILERLGTSNSRLRAKVLWVAAWVALIQSDRDCAEKWLTEGMEISEDLRDTVLCAHMTQWLGEHRFFSGEVSAAIELLEHSLQLQSGIGDTSSELTVRFQLAFARAYAGQEEQALDECRIAVEISNEHGERWARSYAHWVSGICHWHLGNTDQAITAARNALSVQDVFKDGICVALTIELLSWIASSTSDLRSAAELALLANAVWDRLGTTAEAFGPHLLQDSIDSAERSEHVLEDDERDRLQARYSMLARAEIVQEALDLIETPSLPCSESSLEHFHSKATPLTQRELQVAHLISDGQSNREIAEQLFISKRTVDGHVERIFDKLGVSSRTLVAAWVTRQQLAGSHEPAEPSLT